MKLRRCVILDSSGIFHLRNLAALNEILQNSKVFITDKVLQEIKDPRSEAILSILNVQYCEIDDSKIRELKKKYTTLSEADLSIILCSQVLQQICEEVVVITDDSELAKALSKIGVKCIKIYFRKRRASK